MMHLLLRTGSLPLIICLCSAAAIAQPAESKPKDAIAKFGTPVKGADGKFDILKGIESVVFTADSSRIAAGRRDGMLMIWEVESAKEIAAVKAHEAEINSILRKGPKSLLTASHDGLIKEWGFDGKPVKTYPKLSSGAWTMAISNNGRKLAVGLNTDEANERLLLLDASTGRVTQKLKGPRAITGLAFAPDDLTLLLTDMAVMQMWNLQTSGKLWQRGQESNDEGFVNPPIDSPFNSGCAFSPDKKYAASTVDSQMGAYVLIWDAKTGKGHKRFETRSGHVHFAFSPDSKWIGLGGNEPEVVIYNVETGKIAHDFTEPGERVMCIAFSPDGKRMATGSWDSTVTVWDLSVLAGK